MAGPSGSGCINFDSFVTATPPPTPAAAPKQINGGDKKYGPPKPKYLGGTTTSNHGFGDNYFE
jgi:hypothetical protein